MGCSLSAFCIFSPARIGTVEPVLLRRERAVVLGAVVAVRVIGDVEVDDVDAGRRRIELHVAPGRVGFGAARQIGERHEQPLHVPRFEIDERRQPQRLALQREFQRADALDVADLAGRGRHLDARALRRRLERRGHRVAFVDRKVGEREERRLLVGGHRRVRIALEALVLGGADRRDLRRVVFFLRRARRERDSDEKRPGRIANHVSTIACLSRTGHGGTETRRQRISLLRAGTATNR